MTAVDPADWTPEQAQAAQAELDELERTDPDVAAAAADFDHAMAQIVRGVVLPGRCRSPHPKKAAECGRRLGHPGSHQDGDVVWRKVGDAPVREIPDRVSDEDLERMVTALHVEGAWCGDCDYESGPCEGCRRSLSGYARAVLAVVGIEA